jgi:hypothetical protein
MKTLFVLTALGLLGLSGCGAAREPSQNKDAAPAPPTSAGDESQAPGAEYTMKFKDITAGDVAHITETRTSESTSTATDATGKVLKEDHSSGGETFVYTQTILEKPDKSKTPTRVRRQYERAEKKSGDKTMPMGFHGKTVLIEKKGGKWRFQYEGGPELALADAMIVYRDFHEGGTSPEDQRKRLLAKKPVKVGETWPLDAEAIARQREKALLFRLDPAKAVGRGKLQRAYQQNGHQFGVLEFTVDTPIVAIGKDKVDEGSRLSQKLSLDGCIDGTSGTLSITEEEKTNISGALTGGGGKSGKLTMNVQAKAQVTRKDLGKK